MTREDDLAEVQRLAAEIRVNMADQRELTKRILNSEHGFELGLLSPYDCGLWVDERGSLYRRLADLRGKGEQLFDVYRQKRFAYYQKYVSLANSSGAASPPCPSTRPFIWGVG